MMMGKSKRGFKLKKIPAAPALAVIAIMLIPISFVSSLQQFLPPFEGGGISTLQGD